MTPLPKNLCRHESAGRQRQDKDGAGFHRKGAMEASAHLTKSKSEPGIALRKNGTRLERIGNMVPKTEVTWKERWR